MKKLHFLPLLALTAVMASCGGSSDKTSLDYIAVQTSKDAKWGFVGPDGKMLYEEEFEKQPTPVLNGFFTVEENDGISVYAAADKKPELVAGCEDLKAAGVMSEGLIPITKKNSRIQLVDASGKEKYTFMPVDGKEVIRVGAEVRNGVLPFVNEDNKCGLITTSGKVKIPAKFDYLTYRGEGMVFAAVLNEPDSTGKITATCHLFNTGGKEVIKFKDEINIESLFKDGHALVTKGEEKIPGFIDKKGEFTKLPGKVDEFGGQFDGNVFTFKTDDDKYGVMNLEGEVVIRPKYDFVGFYNDGRYYVKDGEKKWAILDKTGVKEKTYDDYEYFMALGTLGFDTKFEVVAAEKEHQIDFYNYDGKPLTQESFYDANILGGVSTTVETDYFNAGEVGNKIAALINEKGVKGIALGTPISNVIPKDSEAKEYAGVYSYTLPDVAGGYKWSLQIDATTDGAIAEAEYTTETVQGWFYSYQREVVSGYKFNNAKVAGFNITASSVEKFTDEAMKAIEASLAKRGFKKSSGGDLPGMTVLKKGDMTVSMYPNDDKDVLNINVSSQAQAPQIVEEVDSVAVDTVVAVEEVGD